MNFYIDPSGNSNTVLLNTAVFRSGFTSFQHVSVNTSANVIDVSICYQNSAASMRIFDTQQFEINLPPGYTEYTINVYLYGDNDGLPCQNIDLADSGSITFDYPYLDEQLTAIPDSVFEYYLENTFSGDDIVDNGAVLTRRIRNIKNLFLSGYLFPLDIIYSLEGIQAMNRVEFINCSNNSISEIYLLNMPRLRDLNCGANLISELDVSSNLELERLVCSANLMTSVDLSQNLVLREAYLGGDNFNSVDLQNNLDLEILSINSFVLEGLDVTNNINLKDIGLANMQLDELDLSNNDQLEELVFQYVNAPNLTLINPAVSNLEINNGEMPNLDVSGLIGLTTFRAVGVDLGYLEMESIPGLEQIDILGCDITGLDTRGWPNPEMVQIISEGNDDLFCIDVDDPESAPYPLWWVEEHTSFSQDCSLSVSEFDRVKIDLYPNPARDYLYIEAAYPVTRVQLYDVHGKKIHIEPLVEGKINLGALQVGLYILVVESEKTTVTRRIVKY